MRIYADTDAMLTIADKYEKLSAELIDAEKILDESLKSLTSATPNEDHILQQVSSLIRKTGILKYEVDSIRIKLRFAARTYEETDKRLQQLSHECADHIRHNERGQYE